jgi:hypothetical protein
MGNLNLSLEPCHTILAGDWNYVAVTTERLCLTRKRFTGERDKKEASYAEDVLFRPHSFHELQQDSFTYFHNDSTSKIDRIYSNHHPATQLDHHYHCTALSHPKGLSKHSPVSFGRATSSKQHTNHSDDNTMLLLQPIKHETLHDPEWKDRVAAEYYHNLFQDEQAHNPIRRLLLLKQAIRKVSDNIQSCNLHAITTHNIDLDNHQKLSSTMAFIRAAEMSDIKHEHPR